MKKKMLNVILLGIMILGIGVTANAAGKSRKSNRASSVRRSNRNGNYIGANRARAIALSRVPGANSSHVRNLHLDWEDGRMVYEGKIYFRGLEYEFDIDAVSGRIVKWDVDND